MENESGSSEITATGGKPPKFYIIKRKTFPRYER
jgi:hypothetical protein